MQRARKDFTLCVPAWYNEEQKEAMDVTPETAEAARLRKDLERLRVLRPIDDGFMRCLFKDDLPLVQFVLRIIMQKPELIITRCETQKDLKRLAGSRSLELDVHAEEPDGTEYDIEVERSRGRAEPRRVRYHQSAMDVESLGPQEDFSRLPETYVIFIAEEDIFGEGRALYRIERMDADTGRLFGDGAHILYVNGAYRGDSDIGKLMHDFCCSDAKDMYLEPMAERTRYLKESQKGVAVMCKVFEDILNEGRKEGRKEGREEGREEGKELALLASLRSLMEKLGYSPEQAMDALSIPDGERAKLQVQL